jgi:hypothetical protein
MKTAKNTLRVTSLVLGASAVLTAIACGSDNSDIPNSGSTDGGAEAMPQQGGSGSDGGNTVDGAGATDGGGGGDAGQAVPCDPPSDPTKAALCIQVSHETIDFIAGDKRLDGKGVVIAQVFSTAHPDYPDGGEMAALSTETVPSFDGGVDASVEFDLTNAIPVLRFDGLPPGTVYPRVFFIDNQTAVLTAGWWVAGLDLSQGLKDGLPIGPATLVKGQGTGVAMSMTALRSLSVDISRSVSPFGDGQGVATVIAVDTNKPPSIGGNAFGIAQGCIDLSQNDASATVTGLVVGKGPYYLDTALDDYGAAEGGTGAGALVSADVYPDGSVFIPEANKVVYAPTAYVVSHAVVLNVVLPKPSGGDKSSCP